MNDGINFQESASNGIDGREFQDSASSNGSGDLVGCFLGTDVHQSLHCLCDHSYFQFNGPTARSRLALVAKYTKLTSQPLLLWSQHHSWSHLLVQSAMSALNETKEWAYNYDAVFQCFPRQFFL